MITQNRDVPTTLNLDSEFGSLSTGCLSTHLPIMQMSLSECADRVCVICMLAGRLSAHSEPKLALECMPHSVSQLGETVALETNTCLMLDK